MFENISENISIALIGLIGVVITAILSFVGTIIAKKVNEKKNSTTQIVQKSEGDNNIQIGIQQNYSKGDMDLHE